jgi:hypothetical protein
LAISVQIACGSFSFAQEANASVKVESALCVVDNEAVFEEHAVDKHKKLKAARRCFFILKNPLIP